MSLSSGTRLGPYEIVAPIGAGGMGEVYKATDTRLGRTVAIKLLPAEFAADARLKLRLEREAKVISSLSHPNICTLFDVGDNYLVMEHCEGQTLAQRLERGPLPLDKVVEYGIQIAEALDKAHRKGIIHRDLKPSNIVVTDGGLKLIDFGLARQGSRGAFISEPSPTTTLQKPITEEGKIAGTVQYMAPETLSHGIVESRSDIYALGLVLYEMARGKPVYHDHSRARLIAAILEREAPSPSVRPDFDRLVRDCLRKEPDERWQSAGDVARHLRSMAVDGEAIPARSSRRARATLAAGAVVILGIVAAATFLPSPKRSTQKRISSIVVDEAPLTLRSGRAPMAISPDGASFVYLAGQPQRLFHRSFDTTKSREISDTQGAAMPFFSPDSQWIGFIHQGKLKKVSVNGGNAHVIAQNGAFDRPSWGDDGTIVFGRNRALFTVRADGGEVREILRPKDGDTYERPSFLPGGTKMLYSAGPRWLDPRERDIAMYDLESGKATTILKGGTDARYSKSGHLLFGRTGEARERTGTIYSIPFDAASGLASGVPVPRVTDVEAFPANGSVYWSVGPQGEIYYVPSERSALERELVWLDGSGTVVGRIDRVARFADFILSPDGRRIAYSDFSNIWVGDLERGTWMQLPSIGWWAQQCIWSPDGTSIAYQTMTESRQGIAIVPSDGTAPPRILAFIETQARPTSWSADGKNIAFDGGGGVSVIDVATRQISRLDTPRGALTPSFSPDGGWVAFMTVDEREHEIIQIQSYPNSKHRMTIYTGPACPPTASCGNNVPRWSSDGGRIYFRDAQKIVSVSLDRHALRAGKPEIVFDVPFDFTSFNVSADGRRFLVERFRETPRWNQIDVVSGWAD